MSRRSTRLASGASEEPLKKADRTRKAKKKEKEEEVVKPEVAPRGKKTARSEGAEVAEKEEARPTKKQRASAQDTAEKKTSRLKETEPKEVQLRPGTALVARMAEEGASVNDIRFALEALNPNVSSFRGGIPPTYIPWHTPKRRKEFERLLAKDREQNFGARINYYNSEGVLSSVVGWLDTIVNGGHCAYSIIDDPAQPPFIFSIGLHYWYDLPELLILLPKHPRTDSSRGDAARLLNAAARKLKLDSKSIKAGTTAKAVFGTRFAKKNTKFEMATADDVKKFMGSASWFNINFADKREYPVLKITLETEEGEQGTIDAVSTALYESSGNVVAIQHGKLKKCPVPTEPGNGAMGLFVSMIFTGLNAADFPSEKSKSFKITDQSKFQKAPGAVSTAVLAKIIDQSPFKLADVDASEMITFAMHNGRIDNLKLLIERGVTVNGDGEARSPLMDAVQFGQEEVVHALVEAGCDIEQRDVENWTALSLSLEGRLYDDLDRAKRITKYLWDHGARQL